MFEQFVADPLKFMTPSRLLTLGVGVAIGALVMLIGRFLTRRKPVGGPPVHRFSGGQTPSRPVGSLPPKRVGEKRGTTRREGKSVKVVLASADESRELGRGYIVDRSAGGVGVFSSNAIDVGTIITVRPAGDQPLPWISVEVRNCRRDGAMYLLGCKFTRRVSWSQVMHLG